MSRFRVILRKDMKLTRERMYQIVRQPVITEKSTMGSEHNQVTFRVPLDADKREVQMLRKSSLRFRSPTQSCRCGPLLSPWLRSILPRRW